MDANSQEQAIIDHLVSGRSLTALEALKLYGCFRLAARIHGIRKALAVKSERVRVGTKYVAQYRL